MLSRVPREGAWRDTLAAPLGLLQNKHWTLFLLYASFNKSENRFSFRFSSVPQSCLTLCDHMDCSTPGFPVHHQLPEFALTHVHRVGDAIQSSHPLSSPSPAFNLSQHQGLFQLVSSSHQVAKESWTIMSKSGSLSCGITALLIWVLVHAKFCLCPPRLESLFPSVLWKFYN